MQLSAVLAVDNALTLAFAQSKHRGHHQKQTCMTDLLNHASSTQASSAHPHLLRACACAAVTGLPAGTLSVAAWFLGFTLFQRRIE